jgi:CBS domain containing-hemolysin-like protein
LGSVPSVDHPPDARTGGHRLGRSPDPRVRETTIDTLVALAVSLLLVAVNGVFVTAEFGLVAADPLRLRREAESGDRKAKLAERLVHDLSFQLSGAQLGITITSLLLGYIAEPAVGDVLEWIVGGEMPARRNAIAISIAAIVQMVLGELVLKSLAISYPDAASGNVADALYGIVAGPAIGPSSANNRARRRTT